MEASHRIRPLAFIAHGFFLTLPIIFYRSLTHYYELIGQPDYLKVTTNAKFVSQLSKSFYGFFS